MPVQPFVGFPPKMWVRSSQYVGYTAHWNLLDWAVLSMPMGCAEPNQIDLNEDFGDGRGSWNNHKPRNESDRFNYAQCEFQILG